MRVLSTANVVSILNAACGEAASAELVRAYGGRRIDVPWTVTGLFLETLGEEITAVLVKHFGGGQLDVPSWGHSERVRKSQALKADIMTSGLTANELAARHSVTSAYVRELRSGLCGSTPSALKPRKI